MTFFGRNAQLGEQVFYRHGDDGKTYPAIVSDVRGVPNSGGLSITAETHSASDIRAEEGKGLLFQAHLTIFRPNKIEWKWCVESSAPGGYARKVVD